MQISDINFFSVFLLVVFETLFNNIYVFLFRYFQLPIIFRLFQMSSSQSPSSQSSYTWNVALLRNQVSQTYTH